jgi:hypothetical protein
MYLDALKNAGGPPMPSQPASPGLGPAPNLQGLPPPPTGKGPMPTGSTNAGATKLTAGGEAISSLRNLIGFVPEMSSQITDLIAQIKAKTQKIDNPGPAIGEPGTPGSAQLDGSELLDSGSPGSM